MRKFNAALACVAGVNGKREGERERARKMGFCELGTRPQSSIFLPRSCSPSPSPFTPATQANAALTSFIFDENIAIEKSQFGKISLRIEGNH